MVSTQDARKAPIPADQAVALLDGVSRLFSTKGKKVLSAEAKALHEDDATRQALLIGPSGNLRAPTIRVGDTLVVGFDEATYSEVILQRESE